jgi:uncharacterized membrane protein YphA (DoxX/SURF4 family)
MNSTAAPATSGIKGLQAKFATFDEKVRNAIIGAMRIVVGVLWLANVEWKRPGDFGKDLGNGLYKYVSSAIDHPVFAPYSWFVKNVVVKNYTLFGWITLLTESMLAVLLILGLFTRVAALVGAGMSVSILLSVLYYDKSYEWPWSYFLMIAIHLLVFATAAGQFWGLDGVKARGTYKRAATTLGITAVIVGVLGLVVARNIDFAAKQGALLGWEKWELKVLWFNPLSAIVTAVVGVVALAALKLHRPVVLWVASGVFGLMAVQVLVQWRYNRGEWTGGIFGGTGGTMAFWLLLAIGLAVCAQGESKAIKQ